MNEDGKPARHVTSWALPLLAVFASIWMLQWTREVCIPIMLGVLISYALSPVVDRLQHWHIPRAIGAAVLLLGIVGGIGGLAYSLGDEAAELIDTLPDAAQNFRRTLQKEGLASGSGIESMQEAANQLEQVASDSSGNADAAPPGVTRVQIERPRLNVQDFLRTGTLGFVAVAGQAALVLFLVFFLLLAGDTFRRKLISIAGSKLSEKKVTLQALDEITSQIQRYLLVQFATSVLVGVATWLAFRWIGVDHAAIWGIAAGVFNTVPYLGAVFIAAGSTIVAFLQFGSLGMASAVGGISLLITGLEGYLLTPWLTGRASRMNPVVVFVGVLFWGWLWGVWGLLLGVPVMMVVKTVCDHVEELQPVGELLGA